MEHSTATQRVAVGHRASFALGAAMHELCHWSSTTGTAQSSTNARSAQQHTHQQQSWVCCWITRTGPSGNAQRTSNHASTASRAQATGSGSGRLAAPRPWSPVTRHQARSSRRQGGVGDCVCVVVLVCCHTRVLCAAHTQREAGPVGTAQACEGSEQRGGVSHEDTPQACVLCPRTGRGQLSGTSLSAGSAAHACVVDTMRAAAWPSTEGSSRCLAPGAQAAHRADAR